MNISTLKDIKDERVILTANELYRHYQADLIFPSSRLRNRFIKDPGFIRYYNGLCIREDTYEDCLIMTDSSMVCGIAFLRFNGFETDIFGRKMGHLHVKLRDGLDIRGEDIEKFVDAMDQLATKDQYRHVGIKISVGSVPLGMALQKRGYIYIAGLVTFVYVRHKTSVKRLKNLYRVRFATDDDKERILEISENAFSGTRFTNDPSLDRAKCAVLYREWIKRCFDAGWASNMFAAVNSRGEVVGFLTYLIDADLKEKANVTKLGRGLAACAPDSKGAYVCLLQTSLDLDLQKTNADFIEYTIPIENLEVISICNRFGFKLSKTENIFRKEF